MLCQLCPTKDLNWVPRIDPFLFQAHQNLSGNSASLVRNELVHTDIKTGKNVSLRATGLEEPPIQMIRVSHLKQVKIKISYPESLDKNCFLFEIIIVILAYKLTKLTKSFHKQ